MQRRELIALLGCSAVAWPIRTRAQPREASHKIGYVHPFGTKSTFIVTLLRQRWQDLGYVEGETALLREAQGDIRRIPGLVTELVSLDVGVLVVVGRPAIEAALSTAPGIPVVGIDLETDPVKAGLIRSWAKPGGNLTGLFLDQASLTGKWLELLREVVPGLKRVVLAWDPNTGSDQLEAAQTAARAVGIEAFVLKVSRPEEFDAAFGSIRSQMATGVVLLGSPTLTVRRFFADVTLKFKIPSVTFYKPIVKDGGLMSYGPVFENYFPRAISMAHNILNGAAPGEMPVERPDRYELVINMKTAEALGLEIPAALLWTADEVLE